MMVITSASEMLAWLVSALFAIIRCDLRLFENRIDFFCRNRLKTEKFVYFCTDFHDELLLYLFDF
jgi:hypothetical protein